MNETETASVTKQSVIMMIVIGALSHHATVQICLPGCKPIALPYVPVYHGKNAISKLPPQIAPIIFLTFEASKSFPCMTAKYLSNVIASMVNTDAKQPTISPRYLPKPILYPKYTPVFHLTNLLRPNL